MTTELSLRFPWGRYHGTPWGRHVNEGAVDWPPSPWRLLRALYATWCFRAPELDAVVVESVLGKLADPPSYDLPRFTMAATRHYMPGKEHRQGVSSERDLVVDSFVVVAPDAELRVRWDVDLIDDEIKALQCLLHHLTYLGRAESLCDGVVVQGCGPHAALPIQPLLDPSGDVAIDVLVPATPLDISALTVSTTQVRSGDRRRLPAGARMLRYCRPAVAVPVARGRRPAAKTVQAVRWSLAGRASPSRHAAVALNTRLRQRAMSIAGADDRVIPPVLHGKSDFGDVSVNGHGHAHWLSFGGPSERLLHTVVVWATDGFDGDVLANLAQLNKVCPGGIPDFGPQRLGIEGWGEIGEVAPELVGPSQLWRSFTPFAPNVHRKKEPTDEAYLLTAVRRELRWRELPEVASVELDRGPWRAYRTHRPDKERLRDSRRTWGLQVRFHEEVSGPLVLGALSHFGLGLFLPSH